MEPRIWTSNISISFQTIGILLTSVCFSVLGASILPVTKGFTAVAPSIMCVGSFAVALWLMSILVARGGEISILVPFSSALTPLGTVVVGALVFGEPMTVVKAGLLLVACGLITAAGIIG